MLGEVLYYFLKVEQCTSNCTVFIKIPATNCKSPHPKSATSDTTLLLQWNGLVALVSCCFLFRCSY